MTILEYEPIRPQASDAAEWFVVTQDFGPWKKGQVLHLTPQDPDVLDKIGDAIGGVVGFFEDAVNWVATAYQDIKNTAIDVVASSIPGCGGTCRDVLSYGLDTGLAACGLPPDLPNFDELVEMGKGNLAATLVAQAGLSDVPFSEELAKEMMDKVTEQATRAADTGPGGTQFLRPLPDKQYRPAFVRVRITNPANAGTRDVGPRLPGLEPLPSALRARARPQARREPHGGHLPEARLSPTGSAPTCTTTAAWPAATPTWTPAGLTSTTMARRTCWPARRAGRRAKVNVVSGRPVIGGSQDSDYIKQRPVQAYHGG